MSGVKTSLIQTGQRQADLGTFKLPNREWTWTGIARSWFDNSTPLLSTYSFRPRILDEALALVTQFFFTDSISTGKTFSADRPMT
jgi:hypothetical protein